MNEWFKTWDTNQNCSDKLQIWLGNVQCPTTIASTSIVGLNSLQNKPAQNNYEAVSINTKNSIHLGTLLSYSASIKLRLLGNYHT